MSDIKVSQLRPNVHMQVMNASLLTDLHPTAPVEPITDRPTGLRLDQLPAPVQRVIKLHFRERLEHLTAEQIQELFGADLSILRTVGPKRAEQVINSILSALDWSEPPCTVLTAADLPLISPRLNPLAEQALILLEEVERLGRSLRTDRLHPTARLAAQRVLGQCPDGLTPGELRGIVTTDLKSLQSFGELRERIALDSIIEELQRIATGLERSERDTDGMADVIHREGLLPEVAAQRFGLTESEIRTRIATGIDRSSARVASVWTYYDLARKGRSLASIGEEFGISRERVRQLLARYGVSTIQLRKGLTRRTAQAEEERRNRVTEFVRLYPGVTDDEICHMLEVDRAHVQEYTRSVRHLILQPADASEQVRLAQRKDMLIASLRAAAQYQSPLSGARYEELVQAGLVPGPGRQTVFIVFGSWIAGCEAAGIAHLDAVRSEYERNWDDSDILLLVSSFLLDERFHGTAAEFETFSKENNGPSMALLRNRFAGSWAEPCRQALIRLRHQWAQGDDRLDFDSWCLTA
jgi:hypothetical protein